MENVTGRGRSGRSVEEEEGSGKEREKEGRTERDGGSWLAGGEVRVSEAVASVRGGGGSSLPSHTLAHTHTHAHARPVPVFGGARGKV